MLSLMLHEERHCIHMANIISFKHKGDFSKTTTFLERCRKMFHNGTFDKYGKLGVETLRAHTPRDSGKTADSWDYEIRMNSDSLSIYWTNSNVNEGVPIAVIIQYGHGTGNGGYVKGVDYINPAMKSAFDNISKSVWKEVTG